MQLKGWSLIDVILKKLVQLNVILSRDLIATHM